MKIIPIIMLFIFVSFLSVPTIVTVIEKKSNVSMCFSFSEEEFHKNSKEIKANFKFNFDYKFVTQIIVKNPKIISKNVSIHDNVSEEIFSPPPEIV